MSGYTLTTQEIRDICSYEWDEETEKDIIDPVDAQAFDRWLAAHDQALRERIARNIEHDEYIYGDSPLLTEGKFVWGAAIRTAARIARGEQA